ncbi:hypothetical protein [Gordonia sp. NPDC003376]
MTETITFDGFARANEARRAGVSQREAQASDDYMQRTVTATRIATEAAHANQPKRRPQLSAKLSGRAGELWTPHHRRTMRGFQRVMGRLTVEEITDPTPRIIANLRAQGEAGEALDDTQVAAIADYHRRRLDEDAMAIARRELRTQVAADLTADVRDLEDDLLSAVRADLEDLAKLAEQVVEGLDGVDSAEAAITRGDAAVSAWSTRGLVRERVITVACSLHWVRRAVKRGFAPDTTGRPDAWPPGTDDELVSSATWSIIDATLDDMGVSDAAIEIMTGAK